LVIGVDTPESIPVIAQELMGKMSLVLPERQFIDIIPFATSSMPDGARVAACKIYEAKAKAWWKLW